MTQAYRTYRFRDGKVPTAIHTTLGNIYASDVEDATHLLIDRLPYRLDHGDYVFDYFGTSVSTLAIPSGDHTYIYYLLDQYCHTTHSALQAVLSRHFMDDFAFYYNAPNAIEALSLPLALAQPQLRLDIDQLHDLKKPKISGDHHIHYTASEVWECLDSVQQDRARAALRLPPDSSTSFVGGVMLWLASLPQVLYDVIITCDLLDAPDPMAYALRAKRLSVQAKSLQNIVPIDLRPVFEADVLVNRILTSIDWVAERDHRVNPRTVDASYDDVYTAAFRLFSQSDEASEPPREFTWYEFWQARWQWAAAGSLHSQYSVDLSYLPSDRDLRNKFIAIAAMPSLPMTHFTARKPSLHAWSSVKYEWAKLRAIYGTDLTSYVLAHFAFFNCEDTLPRHFPIGKKATPSYVNSRVSAVLHDAVPFCIDFEDFNSQHSTAAMQAVLAAYLDVHARHLTPEQRLAAQWTIQSLDDVIIHDNIGTKTTYQASGTLMSGWRLTTFVNSVLNYIYTAMLTSHQATRLRSVHNGDDVLIGLTNFKIAKRVLQRCRQLNIRLQRSKSSFGGIAEFLRVDHIRGMSGQYLTRNIATVLHSRIESKPSLTALDSVEAMEERLAEFVSRGGEATLAARLRTQFFNRLTQIMPVTIEQLRTIKRTHRVAGGISSRPDADIDSIISVISDSSSVELSRYDLPAVDDYAVCLKQSLELDTPLHIIGDRVYSATLNAVRKVKQTLQFSAPYDTKRLRVWKALYKAYADVTDNALFGKAKMTGFVFDVLSKHTQLHAVARIISSAHDPLAFLRVIT